MDREEKMAAQNRPFHDCTVFGQQIRITQQPAAPSEVADLFVVPDLCPFLGEISAVVWPASSLLCKYIEYCSQSFNDDMNKVTAVAKLTSLNLTHAMKEAQESTDGFPFENADVLSFKDKTVLELGSGTGICGIVCRRFTDAKHVTLTDFASALSLIDKNWRDVVASTTPCNAERQNEFALEELVWGKENASLLERRRFDIVIASDVVYQQEAHEPLVKTLLLLFERNPRLVVLVAHKRRSTVDVQFLQRLTRAGLRVRDLLRAPTQQFITAHEFKALDLDETFHLFEIWGTSTTTSQ